jgi:hypothetical protein
MSVIHSVVLFETIEQFRYSYNTPCLSVIKRVLRFRSRCGIWRTAGSRRVYILEVKAVCSFETSGFDYPITRRQMGVERSACPCLVMVWIYFYFPVGIFFYQLPPIGISK